MSPTPEVCRQALWRDHSELESLQCKGKALRASSKSYS